MKILPNNIDTYLKSGAKACRIFLLYGPNTGLVSERADILLDQFLEKRSRDFALEKINYNEIKGAPELLFSALNQLPFGGGNKVIVLNDFPASLTKDFEKILDSETKAILIVTSDDLGPTSSTRKYFENSKTYAAIPCYMDDELQVQKIFQTTMAKYNIRYDSETLARVRDLLSGDRIYINSQVEKLVTYLGEKKNLTATDVEDCITDKIDNSLDDLLQKVANKQPKEAFKTLELLLSEGIEPIMVARVAYKYFQKILQVKESMVNSLSLDEALKKLKPPLFYKAVPIFKQHLAKWNIKDLLEAMELANKLELESKMGLVPSKLLLENFLVQLFK